MYINYSILIKASLLIVIGAFFSCKNSKNSIKNEYRYYGLRLEKTKEFNLNTFDTYREMYDTIETYRCNEITPIIVFENDTAVFKICSFKIECPREIGPIWCPNDNQLLEINASSIFYPMLEKTYPIDRLSIVLPQFYKEDFTRKVKHKNDSYRFTFIGFERNLPVISVKNTMEHLFLEFNKLKVENDSLKLLIDFRENEKFMFNNIAIEN